MHHSSLVLVGLGSLLVTAGCASGPKARPSGPPEPDVTLVSAGAAAKSPFVPETIDVALETRRRGSESRPTDPMDGIQARQAFTRAAAARGARYVSDLEFHVAVHDQRADGPGDFDCVVQMKTLPAGETPAASPPDELTTHLSRDQRVRLVRPSSGSTCVQLSTVVQMDPYGETGLRNTTRTVSEQRCITQTSPVVVLPYWAYAAWFLPVFYDREHPPVSARWQLYVSDARCVPVATRLEHSFVRGTIYLPPSAAAPAAASPAPAPTAPR